jgi:hypothetical protein
MAERTERRPAEVRAELQVWYLTDLRPKLASAARQGKVRPDQAETLDLQVRELLGVPGGDHVREAA